ncbi:GL25892 [Drosophila persimilis]|uniref:M-phase phosphoprotein 6 n=2 Tax=pseudoobscura subgroup TaxID=32358 RepID=A0A6I8ULY2_DROPS|nr:M-phase phosphoprotein 6 [Drosophila pseudoobscura]XP_002018609.1 M-phase phosphoprotein 6 [Drosophila persimilis]EDW36805.1 GL25892 [Drosophila persimilis]
MPSKIKPRLSRGVLDMKFMQRTKVKVDKEDDDEQSRALYSNEINEKMLNSNSNFIIEPSYTICAGLIDGRLSFRGMNPDLELLMEQEMAQKLGKVKPEQPKEVSDQEMAKAYYTNKAPSVASNMSKKFSTKNNLKRKQGGNNQRQQKPQFKRPRDEDDD